MRRRALLHGVTFVWVLWLAVWATGCAARGEMAAAANAPTSAPQDATMSGAEQAPSAAAQMSTASETPAAVTPAPAQAPARAVSVPTPSPAAARQQAKSGDAKDESPVQSEARPMLIYEARVGVLVDEDKLADTIEKIIDAAESKGGYLVSRGDQVVSVRVPSQQLRAALAEIEPLGRVTRRSVTAQDVSDQFHDLEVRLKSLEAVRDRLQQFLSRAANMSEAMTIAAQLDQVAQQIDQVKGQMQLLRARSAYSLIEVSLQAKPRAVVAEPRDPPKPPQARPVSLPVSWLHRVGLDSLTQLGASE